MTGVVPVLLAPTALMALGGATEAAVGADGVPSLDAGWVGKEAPLSLPPVRGSRRDCMLNAASPMAADESALALPAGVATGADAGETSVDEACVTCAVEVATASPPDDDDAAATLLGEAEVSLPVASPPKEADPRLDQMLLALP